jgi:DNA topoisomerase-2
MSKSIEQKYRKLSDIEHVLARPGMYIGSTKAKEDDIYFLSSESGRFELRRVIYNPAFLKIFDEIISNSVDEHRRNKKLNEIRVTVNKKNSTVTIWDNGGIPVVKHSEYDEWVPELIFSNLKAGSNFDDSEERLVAGTNGVGSTLTNIFSTRFEVRTCDGKNEFEQIFTNNMRDRTKAEVRKILGDGYTEISFQPDLVRFGMESIDDAHVEIMRKRCVDIAACNSKLKVYFNAIEKSFSSFKDYCVLFDENVIYEEDGDRWKVGIAPSNGSFSQVSFVNSVETKDGGTHVDYIANQVIDWLREKVKRKHKVDLKPSELRNHLFVFVQCDVVNPAFSSQTKEKLITEAREFGSKYEIGEKTLKQILESELVQRILDWAQQKALADERKQLRELNKNLAKGKVLKLIDAKARFNRDRCTLALFEGDSASSAFRKFRDPTTQGAFPLRGKFINVSELTPARVMQNNEVKEMLMAIGLKLGEEPKDLRYGKILIYSDADPDGDSIAGLLINFFGRYWPELLKDGKICRVQTPLVVAKKGAETLWFYTPQEFETWVSSCKNIDEWDVSYKKGLAALEDAEYKEIIQNPKMFSILPGEDLKFSLDSWFSPAGIDVRKSKILGVEYNPEEESAEQPDSIPAD